MKSIRIPAFEECYSQPVYARNSWTLESHCGAGHLALYQTNYYFQEIFTSHIVMQTNFLGSHDYKWPRGHRATSDRPWVLSSCSVDYDTLLTPALQGRLLGNNLHSPAFRLIHCYLSHPEPITTSSEGDQ
jgi:hypothetical protein